MTSVSPCVIRQPVVDYLFRYLRKNGLDAGPFEQQCQWIEPEIPGLAPGLDMAQFIDLLDQAATAASDPDLGLHFYEGADWADLGLYGFASLHAETVADTLRLDCRYSQMIQTGAYFSAETGTDNTLTYEYRLLSPALATSRYDNDLSLGGMIQAIRLLSANPDWTPLAADFMHEQPDDLAEYRRLFGNCPLQFGAKANRLVIDAATAAKPIAGRDARLYSVLEADLERLLSAMPQGVLDAVRHEIAQSLSHGVPSIDEVAKRMQLSRRSLQRRLADEGYTYKQLVEQLREQLAKQYLAAVDQPLLEIALLLGYSELSAFIRAFRRWTGDTPQRFRSKRGN